MEQIIKALKNWKVHGLALTIVVACELIGTHVLKTPLGNIVFFPMLYAVVVGILVGLPKFKLLTHDDQVDASTLISISVMLLLAKVGANAGPVFWDIAKAGPALLLQEFGNLGTALVAVPIAVMIGLKREAIGGGHSIGRDANLGLISEMYGIDSEEGRGVLSVYVFGSLLGTIFMGIYTSFLIAIGFFSPEALAMASGVGSGSMAAGVTATLINSFPEKEAIILGLSSTSNMISGFDSIYITLLFGLPMSRWLYNKFYRIKYKTDPEPEVFLNQQTGSTHKSSN